MSDELIRTLNEDGDSLYRIAWRILGRSAEVDDVLQEVVLQALNITDQQSVNSWTGLLKRMTVCRALDRLRRRKTHQVFLEADFPSERNSPVEDAIGLELETRLRKALARLPSRQAEVFSLRYFDDCSNREIAESLGVSPAAVATALRSARLRLAEMLEIELERGRHEFQ
ncbi:MAG: RNA polymerase sigma factor [Planctomycetota bacterium]